MLLLRGPNEQLTCAVAEPQLYADYTRADVHGLFEPDTVFTPQAGKWGLPGIVRLTDRPGDFVLFVTLGKQEGAHSFEESISDIGILRWQSQPAQQFSSRSVIDLIGHNERTNTVYLFLRTSGRRSGMPPPYTYLGPLKYVDHDAERQQPVHIAWELLNWPIPSDVISAMQLKLVSEGGFTTKVSTEITRTAPPAPAPAGIVEESPPDANVRSGETTRSFRAMKRRYISSEESRDLGLKGELLVLEREQRRLAEVGREDLAQQVSHTSIVEGDGAGFDIRSFFDDGRTKFIEVKTTTGPKKSEFLISPNEVAFSAEHPDQFELCRVFNFDARLNSAKSYSIFGSIAERFALTETQYRARIK